LFKALTKTMYKIAYPRVALKQVVKS